jgi:hypothetical protein
VLIDCVAGERRLTADCEGRKDMHKILKASLAAAFFATSALTPTLSGAAGSQLVEFEQ